MLEYVLGASLKTPGGQEQSFGESPSLSNFQTATGSATEYSGMMESLRA